MELPVYVLPSGSGYRATTGGPLDLTADGSTADAAMDALHQLIVARLRAGEVRTLTVTAVDPLLAAARAVGQNPLFEDWVREIEEYRRQHNTPPDVD